MVLGIAVNLYDQCVHVCVTHAKLQTKVHHDVYTQYVNVLQFGMFTVCLCCMLISVQTRLVAKFRVIYLFISVQTDLPRYVLDIKLSQICCDIFRRLKETSFGFFSHSQQPNCFASY